MGGGAGPTSPTERSGRIYHLHFEIEVRADRPLEGIHKELDAGQVDDVVGLHLHPNTRRIPGGSRCPAAARR